LVDGCRCDDRRESRNLSAIGGSLTAVAHGGWGIDATLTSVVGSGVVSGALAAGERA
jgi:hypothetical protein